MKKKIIIISVIALGIVGVILFFIALNKIGKDNNLMIDLSISEFKKKINNKDSFAFIIIQTGCHYCEEFKPIVNEVIKENKIDIYSVNLTNLSAEDKNYLKSVASSDSTPTTIFITDGVEETTLNRLNGKVTKEKLVSRLQSLGYIK